MPEVDAVENDQSGEVNVVHEETTWRLACLSSDTQLTRNPKLWSYNYNPSSGEGIDAYVIDSGIKTDHPNFQGRAKWGVNFVNKKNTD
ncbi:subtilisin-like serine protease [Entomophthora muscae]|uniref:Subtilisin-like serine protease n=1 Tax=Entomophthora muscae TaxID=34485 RepID=A0ACC2UKL3_9FUNG|nr:subtilisin-like serine protease [Entomophthora muscae]